MKKYLGGMRLKELLEKCAERNVLLHPETLTYLSKNGFSDTLEANIDQFSEGSVVTPEMVKSFISKRKGGEKYAGGSGEKGSEKIEEKAGERGLNKEITSLKIIKDFTGESEGEGKLKDFKSLFNDRLEKIEAILRKRNGLQPRTIRTVPKSTNRDVSIIGLVRSKAVTSSDNLFVRIEDKSGDIPILINSKDKDLKEKAENLLLDEVIGVKGNKRKNSDLLMVKDFFRPGIPALTKEKKGKISENIFAAFISDLHIGSKNFLQKRLEKFFSWLRGELGNKKQRKTAKRTLFLVIAGDLVDGVGVYPDQEKDLKIIDIQEQYKEAKKILKKVPENIQIILTPGNHDAVRLAEPQPALPNEYSEIMNLPNLNLVSNPAWIELCGKKILLYHGRSMDDIVSEINKANYENPPQIMKELLKRRHLAPIYGKNTQISPEKKDFLVIDEIPDVFHAGHIHKAGVDTYRGINLINSGTWQSQTSFQKRRGIEPDTCRAALMNLSNGKKKILRF